jgi:hypothetical protein
MNILAQLFIHALQNKAGNNPITKEFAEKQMYGDLLPILPAYLTPNAKDIREGYLGLSDVTQRTTDADVQVSFDNKHSVKEITPDNKEGKAAGEVSSISGGIREVLYEEPGVGGLITMIHSIDAAEAQRILVKYSALGVHDAFYFMLKDIMEGGKDLNNIFKDLMKEYSITNSVLNRFDEVLSNNWKQYLTPAQVKELESRIARFNARERQGLLDKENLRVRFMDGYFAIHQFPLSGTVSINRPPVGAPSSDIQRDRPTRDKPTEPAYEATEGISKEMIEALEEDTTQLDGELTNYLGRTSPWELSRDELKSTLKNLNCMRSK